MTPSEVNFAGVGNLERAEARLAILHAKEVAEKEAELDRLRNALQFRILEARNDAECAATLANAGFVVSPYLGLGIHLTVKSVQLPRLGAAVGRIKVQGKLVANLAETEQAGLTGDCVRVLVKSERFPNLCIWYVKALAPDARCKIVAETKTERKLVCAI